MNEDTIKKAAYEKWEAEGRPEGQHQRHWREAEEEFHANNLPQTSSADHHAGVVPPSGGDLETDEAHEIENDLPR